MSCRLRLVSMKTGWPEALRPGRMRLHTAWIVALVGAHAVWFALGFYARLVPGGPRVYEWLVFGTYVAAIVATPIAAARKYREWFPWGAIAVGFAYAGLFILRPPIVMHPTVVLAVVLLAANPAAACPDCGEVIRRGDLRCNHCGQEVKGKWTRPSMFSTGRGRGGSRAQAPPPKPFDPSAGGKVEVQRDAPATEPPKSRGER